uniref:hypothetical protein n=1 Tax=Prevotella micans TaxID=189723 RepID=UPI001EE1FC39|nr:hypothetical protein [Prevotella micans]
MLIVEQLLTGCGELLMLEIFRRCLYRENQYFVHLAAVVLMVLMALDDYSLLAQRYNDR